MKKFTLILFTLLALLPVSVWGEVETIEFGGVTYTYTPVTEGTGSATVKSIDQEEVSVTILPSFQTGEPAITYNVTTINNNAFSGCTALQTLTIEAEITSSNFARNVLKDCESLQTLIFKQCSSLSSLDINFIGSTINTSLCIVYGGVKYYHHQAWSAADNYFSVGNGNNNPGYDNTTSAEFSLSILEKVCTIPVTKIADYAFSNTAEDFSINIPKSITTISNLSFIQNKLTDFTVADDNPNYKHVEGVLFSKDETTLICFPTKKGNSYTIPIGVTKIGNDAFNNHQSLSSITIPESVTTIGESAFNNAGIATITFPNGLTTIGASAFNNTNLTTVNFPASLTSIGAKAFKNCSNLETLNFANPNNNLTIGSEAFYNCKLSGNIYLPEKVTTIGRNAFNRSNSTSPPINLYLPSTANFSNAITNDFDNVYRKIDINFESGNKYTTYFSTMDLNLPEGLTAYTIMGVNGTTLTTTPLHSIPQGKAVLLELAEGKTSSDLPEYYGVPSHEAIAQDENISFNTDLFRGSTTTTNLNIIPGNKYILNGDKFVKITQGTLPAFRCYLVLDSEIDIPANYYTFNNDGNSYIYKEDGAFIKKSTNIGSASLSVTDGNNIGTLTVTPKDGFYTHEITMIRSVKASSARAPQKDDSPISLTPTENGADPSGVTTYTFAHTNGATYEVTVDFKKRKSFQNNQVNRIVNLEEYDYTFDGSEKKPEVISVTYDGEIVDPSNYAISYQKNVNAGTGEVHITGKRLYINNFHRTFSIKKRNINQATIKAIPDMTYNGGEIKPIIDIKDVIEGSNIITTNDFEINYKDNINVGKATVTIKSKEINYTSTRELFFNIVPKDLSLKGNKPTIEPIKVQYYTGEPIKPEIVIKDGELTISPDYYDVKYSNNTYEGEATVNITFKGNYKGTAKTTFKIDFKEEKRTLNVDFGNDEWTTYYSSIDLKKVEGLNIFVVTGLNKEKGIDLKTEAIEFIPKNTGVLLQRTDKAKTTFTGKTLPSKTTLEDVTPDKDLFRGTSTGIEDMKTIDGIKYILVNDRFIQAIEGPLPANRCYIFISNDEKEGINHVEEGDADGVIILEEGENSKTAGTVTVSEVSTDGYKTITIKPASVLYATKDEIRVVRSIKNLGQASSRNRAPGIENDLIEISPVDATADPSGTTQYKFKYNNNYNYQVTVDFKKRIDLSKSINNPVVTLNAEDIKDLVYDGKAKTPKVDLVTCNGTTVSPSFYTITYQNNTNAGRPRVIITGKRFLMGSTHAEFSISQRDFSNASIEVNIPDQKYTGLPIEPTVGIVVKDIIIDSDGNETNILKEDDYIFEYKNNIEIGTAIVTIKPAMKNYKGSSRDFTFNIIPATGIDQITIEEQEGQWYDLNGQRINRPTQKGIYILHDKNKKMKKVRVK